MIFGSEFIALRIEYFSGNGERYAKIRFFAKTGNFLSLSKIAKNYPKIRRRTKIPKTDALSY